MSSAARLHNAARRSLASIAIAAGAITTNHFDSLGATAFALGAFLILAPTAVLLWYRRTRSAVAVAVYAAIALWVVIGFGLYKGLWLGVLRLFLGPTLASLSASFPRPVIGSYAFEASGILMFVSALFVARHSLELIRAARDARGEGQVGDDGWAASPRRARYAPVVAALASAGIVGLYITLNRDRFVPPPNGVVTIGVIAPVTGPYAMLGSSFVKAVEMARDDLRGTKFRYELRVEDSGTDPANAGPHVRRVIDEENVGAVIGAVSLIGQVTKPFATRARIPHLCVCTVASIGDGGYNFTNIPLPEAEAVHWVAEARRRGNRTVGVIQQDYPSINNHVNAMKAEAGRQGLRIVYDLRFADSVRTFAPVIARAKAAKADVYYVEALEPQLDMLAQELADSGVRNIASVVTPSLSRKPWLFEGTWYTDSDLADTAFKRRFETKYPGTQFATHMMPYAYDSFNMIVSAYEQDVNPAVFVRNLTSYVGAAGTVTKRRGSGNFESAPTVWTIANGKPTLLRDVAVATARAARAER